MAQTKRAKEKETNKEQNQTQLEETRQTQTPPSRQAGANEPLHPTFSNRSRNQGLSRQNDFSPFGMMRRFRDEMDRVFNDFGFGGDIFSQSLGTDIGGSQFAWSPQIESFERDGNLVLQADLPGMSKDDINVDIEDDRIVIHGERRNERETNEKGFYHSERSYGSFHRSIPLPEGIDADNAEAKFDNGVLEITMPMPKQMSNRRSLEIGSSSKSSENKKSETKSKSANK